MIYASDVVEKDALRTVAGLMAAAARTAPKAKGVDTILTMVVDGAEKDAIAAEMRKIAEGGENFASFGRDAGNVDASEYVVLLAATDKPVGLSLCSLCGFENCAAATAAGAPCAFNISDLGTAACSACVVASNHFVDNRLMYTVGMAASRLGLFNTKVRACYGIPISTKGKSVYFDRK
ncbi:MAG: DUF2148 domain-containing protein [Clostridiales bacterium]|nr:DUF2148 domain-containing protein [Clostridiales bacterium]